MASFVPIDHDPFAPRTVAVEYDPFAQGDPETTGAVASSQAMQPAIESHLRGVGMDMANWAEHQATINSRLQGRPVAAQALDPEGLASAISVALAAGPGAIRAYHGSPHDFDAFDLSKIGTGEGAQSYGHGLYFSEHPDVARTYQSKVSAMIGTGGPTVEGRPIDWNNPLETAAFELMRHNGDRSAAADFFERTFAKSEIPSILRSDAILPEVKPAGRMYEVNINAEPEQFLNWDKPLIDQPQAVQDAFGQRVAQIQQSGQPTISSVMTDIRRGTLPGGSVYQTMGRGTPESASATLNEAGIPGIRYLDQGSRGAGDGTHNYVVFDPKLIEIVRKYGVAGLMATGSFPTGQYLVPVDHDPFSEQ